MATKHLNFPVPVSENEIEKCFFCISNFGTGNLFPNICSRKLVRKKRSRSFILGNSGKPRTLSFFISLFLSFFLLEIQVKQNLSFFLSIFLSFFHSFFLSLSLSLCLTFFLSLCLSFFLSLFLSFFLSLSLVMNFSVPFSRTRSRHCNSSSRNLRRERVLCLVPEHSWREGGENKFH